MDLFEEVIRLRREGKRGVHGDDRAHQRLDSEL